MSFFSDRDIDHCGVGTDGSGPGYGDDIVIARLIRAADHYRRKGIKKIAGLIEPDLAHIDSSLCLQSFSSVFRTHYSIKYNGSKSTKKEILNDVRKAVCYPSRKDGLERTM